MSYPTEQYEQNELEKYLKLAPGDTRMTGVLASEVVSLRSQLAQAKAELEVERKSREDYARLLDDLATAIDASNFAEAIALAKQYAFRLGDGGER